MLDIGGLLNGKGKKVEIRGDPAYLFAGTLAKVKRGMNALLMA